MLISKDALLSTLLFMLPGFIAVGSMVLPFRWLNPPDLAKSTFIILALSLSVPLNMVFAWLARITPEFLKLWVNVPTLASGTLTLPNLAGVTLLYLFSAAVGLLVAVTATFYRNLQWKNTGTCVQVAREPVWHRVVKSRTSIPWVIALEEKVAYYGKLRHFTTVDGDPHIYLIEVQLVPVSSTSGLPLMGDAQEPTIDGVVLRLDSLKALWFVTK